VSYTNGIGPGQQLQLYWFPSLTLASNTLGVTYYGKYTDTNSPPLDGGAVWQTPAGGSGIELNFLTEGVGGSNPETAGRATFLTDTPLVPPVASFTANPTSGVAPLAVTFTDTSTGSPTLGLSWDLGDSSTTNTTGGATFTHTYAPGTYTVTLVASNSVGTSTLLSNNLITVTTAFQGWQLEYLACTNCPEAQGNADPDGDGMSNTNEFLAGFNPTNSAAYLHIISIVKSGNDINVIYLGANGDTNYAGGPSSRTNVLECAIVPASGSFTNSFVSAGQTNILSGGTGSGVATNMVDPGGATNVPSRYYRIRVLVP
jgi:PKD repeat protein